MPGTAIVPPCCLVALCLCALFSAVFSSSDPYCSISNLGPFRERLGHTESWEDVGTSCLLKVWGLRSGCGKRKGDSGKAAFGGLGLVIGRLRFL